MTAQIPTHSLQNHASMPPAPLSSKSKGTVGKNTRYIFSSFSRNIPLVYRPISIEKKSVKMALTDASNVP
jgi:hypothetical protein